MQTNYVFRAKDAVNRARHWIDNNMAKDSIVVSYNKVFNNEPVGQMVAQYRLLTGRLQSSPKKRPSATVNRWQKYQNSWTGRIRNVSPMKFVIQVFLLTSSNGTLFTSNADDVLTCDGTETDDVAKVRLQVSMTAPVHIRDHTRRLQLDGG